MKQLVQLIVDLEEGCPLMNIYEKIRAIPFVKRVLLGQKKYMEIADRKNKYIFPHEEIVFLQASGNYTRIFTNDNKSYCFSYPLKKVSNDLPQDTFLRVHRSYLVNKNYIKVFSKDAVLLTNEQSIPVSRTQKKFLRNVKENLQPVVMAG